MNEILDVPPNAACTTQCCHKPAAMMMWHQRWRDIAVKVGPSKRIPHVAVQGYAQTCATRSPPSCATGGHVVSDPNNNWFNRYV
jgi:hypothetical protein